MPAPCSVFLWPKHHSSGASNRAKLRRSIICNAIRCVTGEIIKIRRITALLIGFFGTLVIIRPGLIELGLGPMILSQAIIGLLL